MSFEGVLLIALIIVIVLTVIAAAAVLIYLRNRGETRRQLKARVAELQALSDAVGAIASATLDEGALCNLVYEHAAKLVDVSNFQLGLFEDHSYAIKLRYSRGVRQPETQFDLSETGGIVGWMRDTSRPLLVRDFQAEMETLPAKPRYVSANPPRSAVFVPMVTSEAVIGAVAIQSERVNTYSDSHLRMLSIIANQAASAIQNARALQLERRRVRQMELVSEVAGSTASVFDLKSLLPKLVQAIQAAFGYYFVGVFLVNEFKQIECVAASHPVITGKRRQMGEGLVGSCISGGKAIILDDATQDQRFMFAPEMPDTRSEAVLPLFIGDRVIGALDLESDQLATFGEADARYLDVLAQQVAIAIEDARLYAQATDRQQLEQELSFAREIQTSFLPKTAPQVPGWSVAGAWEAARQVGGDFYDFIPLSTGEWGVVIADVADKGVPAALFMVMSRTLMRATAFSGRAPADALARVNYLIQSDSASDLFVTALYAQWSPGQAEIRFSNAGHNPPLFCNAVGEVRVCQSKGMALGVLEKVAFESHTLQMQPGDVLLLYTDGMPDALNTAGDEFGMARLSAALAAHRHHDAHGIADALMRIVTEFAGDEPAFDDQTLVVIKRNTVPSPPGGEAERPSGS